MKTTTNKMNATTIVQRSKDILFSQLDDELLAVDAESGFVYSFNESAGRVWELIESPTPIGAVCAQLRKDYAVDEATCERDVIALLQGLYDAGLVQVNDGDLSLRSK